MLPDSETFHTVQNDWGTTDLSLSFLKNSVIGQACSGPVGCIFLAENQGK